jgi:hypothetical protein
MGPALVAFTLLLGIVLACAFLAAAAGAAAWRPGADGRGLRLMGAVLLVAVFHSPLFGAVSQWMRFGPRSTPALWVAALLAGGLAVGAALAVRTGTGREALAATAAGVAAAVAAAVLCAWFLGGPGYVWPATCATIVPALTGLVVAPARLRRLHLGPASRQSPSPPAPRAVPPRPAR